MVAGAITAKRDGRTHRIVTLGIEVRAVAHRNVPAGIGRERDCAIGIERNVLNVLVCENIGDILAVIDHRKPAAGAVYGNIVLSCAVSLGGNRRAGAIAALHPHYSAVPHLDIQRAGGIMENRSIERILCARRILARLNQCELGACTTDQIVGAADSVDGAVLRILRKHFTAIGHIEVKVRARLRRNTKLDIAGGFSLAVVGVDEQPAVRTVDVDRFVRIGASAPGKRHGTPSGGLNEHGTAIDNIHGKGVAIIMLKRRIFVRRGRVSRE